MIFIWRNYRNLKKLQQLNNNNTPKLYYLKNDQSLSCLSAVCLYVALLPSVGAQKHVTWYLMLWRVVTLYISPGNYISTNLCVCMCVCFACSTTSNSVLDENYQRCWIRCLGLNKTQICTMLNHYYESYMVNRVTRGKRHVCVSPPALDRSAWVSLAAPPVRL